MADSEEIYTLLLEALQDKTDARFGVAFMSRLIERGILVKDDNGSVLLYYDGSVLKHAGVLRGGRVTSKWGDGHLWEHNVWEVPSSYGGTTKRYQVARLDLIESEIESEFAAYKDERHRR
jgi:hypothetical protein